MTRPKTRGDCVNGPRPCPYIGCKYHLAVDQKKTSLTHLGGSGKRTINKYDKQDEIDAWSDVVLELLDTLPHTCVLDVAEEGAHTLEDVANVLKTMKQRVLQIEQGATEKLRTEEVRGLLDSKIHKETALEEIENVSTYRHGDFSGLRES